MLSFRPGAQVANDHLDRMAALLFETSYLQYCSIANKLRLPFQQLQRRQNIDPYLGQVRAMFDGADNFTGFFSAATLAEFAQVAAPSHYRDEMKAMDDAYDAFLAQHTLPSDFLVASLAIEARYRGAGLFKAMLAEIAREARVRGCRRIVLTVWEQSEALPMYLAKGFTSCATFDYAWELFFDRLHFMAYDLEST
ncbi:N-acetyltransferase [Massilia sp. CF038]|uniref:GNAT family N-acetyltransferase n=1 Tax=Massilia sp. CF038 TaxID=1881045 RepID=UPI000920CB60|nr:GNAT family N-acetyltransferase [Massilia sp. CF038]SHH56392.1 Acetyltransferase (GNAT) family protein [Massilia sp. CF038]